MSYALGRAKRAAESKFGDPPLKSSLDKFRQLWNRPVRGGLYRGEDCPFVVDNAEIITGLVAITVARVRLDRRGKTKRVPYESQVVAVNIGGGGTADMNPFSLSETSIFAIFQQHTSARFPTP